MHIISVNFTLIYFKIFKITIFERPCALTLVEKNIPVRGIALVFRAPEQTIYALKKGKANFLNALKRKIGSNRPRKTSAC